MAQNISCLNPPCREVLLVVVVEQFKFDGTVQCMRCGHHFTINMLTQGATS